MSPRSVLKEASEKQGARQRLRVRHLIMYAVLLLLVLGYIWYNRLSSQDNLIPEPPPGEGSHEPARFQLSPPAPVPVSAPSEEPAPDAPPTP